MCTRAITLQVVYQYSLATSAAKALDRQVLVDTFVVFLQGSHGIMDLQTPRECLGRGPLVL
jgi:hypothetical protein